ncbi:MAG TPA: prolipoprotein diacylglyceryl transferase [Anaerolineaceae bacterium]|nr:prolipoprotein diacylglyceryl transferase [Anaerolineaceae bacterium]
MPSGVQIGPIFIHFYGILIMLGALAAAWLTTVEARRRGINPDDVWDMLSWVLVGGIVGARIWHILTPPPSMVAQGLTTGWYLTHPLDAIAIWKGGLGIPGAVIGGALVVFIYARRRKGSFWTWTDMIAPGLALAQAIGRWGNFFNQELYGAPTNLPWAIYIDPQHRLAQYQNQAYYHPTFLYESLWNLANMAFLLWLGRSRFASKLKPGDIFLAYLIFYPIGRFCLEFLRLDSSQVAGLNANQTLMAVVALLSALALLIRHRLPVAPAQEVEGSKS